MIAGKHFDPVVGVDIHIIQPPGPVPPLPIPHPFIGFLIDPMDYVPIVGATVEVNGMKRGVAGSSGKCVPPHIPIGGVFVKPPANECEVFMGSQTVLFDGDPATRLGEPVLSCHDIGMPPIPRLKKKSTTKSMVLPTSVVLAVPAGPPVMIGGPPIINFMAMAMKLGMAALGKAFKKLMKTNLAKKAGAAFKKARQKAFGKMKPGFLKCKVLKAEPVNSITGEVVVEQQDFALPGRLPFDWIRTYGSQNERSGLCGHGWETPADARIVFESDGSVTFADGSAGTTLFPHLPPDGSVEEAFAGTLLTHRPGLLHVRTKEGLSYQFTYPEPGVKEAFVESITDRCNNKLRFVRNGRDLLAIEESTGRRIDVTCRNGRIAEMFLHAPGEPQPRLLVQYEYNADGDLVTVFDALKAPIRFAYRDHRVVKLTDRNGLSFYWEYDNYTARGRCIHPYGDGGLYDYRFEYDNILQETRVTDSLGHVTTIQFDDRFLPIMEIDPLGGVTSYEYDDAGRTLAVSDPVGNRTEYEYDDRGNLLKLTRPDGAAVVVEFNSQDQVVKLTDPLGAVWEQTWDTRGLLIEQKSPLGAISKYEYDAQGQLRAFTNPRGARTMLDFDPLGNISLLTDALGHRSQFTHDALGNLIQKIDPLGRETAYRYDLKSRLLDITLPSKSTIHCGYDGEDNLIRYVDENGAETRLEYRGLGEISKRIQPDGHTVQYHYDNEERLTGITNQRGETYKLVRDPLGRIIEEIDYWGQPRRYEYDAAGNLCAAIDPLGRRVDYKCDPLGRIVQKTLPGGVEEMFAYDGNGNIVAMENAHGPVQRVFDLEGRLLKEIQGETFVLENTYDLVGNRIARKTSLGNLIEYTYDRLDQVATVGINGAEPIRMERDAAGQVTRETLTASVSRRLAYNDDGLLTEQAMSSMDGPAFSTRFEYDRAGNLTKRLDTQFGTDSYKYDPVGRILEHVDPQGKLHGYLNDPAGDRLRTRTLGAGDDWRREGEHEGTSYRFDRAGNLTHRRDTKRDLELIWDANQRLIESRDHGKPTRYGYDPLGRRLFKETAGIRTLFFWDGDALVGETVVDATKPNEKKPIREYVYYPETFEPLALIVADAESRQVYNYHNDPNGCPTRMTDAKGRVKWGVTYTAWGKVSRFDIQELDNRIRLQGQLEDPETGLCYNRHRYFDQCTGQFISQDPLGIEIAKNLYEFAVNSLAWIDPWGLNCKLRDAKGRFRKAATAAEELSTMPQLAGKKQADIEKMLKRRGYTSVPAHSGGTVWTKSMPDGNTVAVRLDPPMVRTPPKGFADEVKHAHKEIVPTSAVSGGNYPPNAASKLGDTGAPSTGPRDAHIPIQ
ncbi:MAG: RHS domain-containing protein [Planctomycetes bacterium]|nr:RHS domain-containing protein [Planctomycetota bacterium]